MEASGLVQACNGIALLRFTVKHNGLHIASYVTAVELL